MKKAVILIGILILLATSGFAYYKLVYQPAQVEPEQAYNTTKVRTGDISITASGVGSILPSQKVTIGFPINGSLSEINVKLGDVVSAGQVIARVDSLDIQAQLATDQLNLLTAQQALDDLYKDLPSDQANAQAALLTAQKNLADANYALNAYTTQRCDAASIVLYNGNLVLAQNKYDEALENYNSYTTESDYDEGKIVAYEKLYLAEIALNTARSTLTYCTGAADSWTTDDYTATAAIAQVALEKAQAQFQLLQAGPDPVKLAIAEAKLEQVKLQLETTRQDLEKTSLQAPISGTVTALNATLGQSVSNSSFITIESLDQMVLRFFIEEQDIYLLKMGNPVLVTFDAFPNTPISGQITYIEPTLSTVDGNPAAVAWASFNPSGDVTLLSGMSADVEVVAGEAKGTLLVPVQALRELAPGSYAVFVVQADGSLKMVPVTVGLKDYANAQILSGLQAGDLISTGAVETK